MLLEKASRGGCHEVIAQSPIFWKVHQDLLVARLLDVEHPEELQVSSDHHHFLLLAFRSEDHSSGFWSFTLLVCGVNLHVLYPILMLR